MNNNNSFGVQASIEATPSDDLFTKALNYEIPENMIETIKDSKNPNAKALRYISWASAWGIFKQIYKDATFRVIHNPSTNLPYFYDPEAGIMVETEITANGETHPMWLFVMNTANKAMKLVPYEYQKWNSYNKTWETKGVEAATMFDISKTLLRCLVKNMGIFGFGLTLYTNQDLPEVNLDGENPTATTPQQKQNYNHHRSVPTMKPATPAPTMQTQASTDPNATLRNAINATTDVASLVSLYLDNAQIFETNAELKSLLSNRKKALQSLNQAA